MPINFQDEKNRGTYAARKADDTWIKRLQELVDVSNRHVADIGCGGGIYSKAMADEGAKRVTGVDFSESILASAKDNCRSMPNVMFAYGNAYDTGLAGGEYDVVLERALIHHLDDLPGCFMEACRLLRPEGTIIVQDRTPEDCLLPGSATHIRGYFFSKYPELAQTEIARRHTGTKVGEALRQAGFAGIEEHSFWETRKVYPDIDKLADDLLQRTGRSILHELSDVQLEELVEHIKEQLRDTPAPMVEKDRWTIWKAVKPVHDEA
ncbi:class I SAM-dependent methyltransferase [Paenibacillus sp. NPDC056579]|uniref:class I SAM-dependent methyltransferase n=1 Tax=Paenibacillus sp. NPDC056579 TaxID=3345871 RepID=UPI0036936C1F